MLDERVEEGIRPLPEHSDTFDIPFEFDGGNAVAETIVDGDTVEVPVRFGTSLRELVEMNDFESHVGRRGLGVDGDVGEVPVDELFFQRHVQRGIDGDDVRLAHFVRVLQLRFDMNEIAFALFGPVELNAEVIVEILLDDLPTKREDEQGGGEESRTVLVCIWSTKTRYSWT